jgi:hypothetical protein
VPGADARPLHIDGLIVDMTESVRVAEERRRMEA